MFGYMSVLGAVMKTDIRHKAKNNFFAAVSENSDSE